MARGGPDYLKRISLVDAFGYRDKIPVYETAPWTVRYQAAPANLTEGDWASALADIKGRPIVKAIIDSITAGVKFDRDWVLNKTTDGVYADLQFYKAGAIGPANPVDVQVIVSGAAIDPRVISGAVTVSGEVDVTDEAGRLLGIVYGSLDQLQQRATSKDLYVQLRSAGSEIDPTAIRALTTADIVSVAPATATGTIADVTGNSGAQQLGANSCKAMIVRALAANAGVIRVGDANVSVSRGAELSAGDSIYLNISNTNLVYVYGVSPDKWSIIFVN